VLTCNPADYTGLGARSVTLSPVSVATTTVARPASTLTAAGEATPAEPDAEPNSADGPATPDLVRQAEELIRVLTGRAGAAGNQALREQLGWDEATYEIVKKFLLSTNRIKPARGRGGSVTLA
jgi:hypothetical protein